MNHKLSLQGFTLLFAIFFSGSSYGRVDAASVIRSLTSAFAMAAPASSGSSSASSGPDGQVGCGEKIVINCDTHEIDDGLHKSKVNCGRSTPKSYRGKVGGNRKCSGTSHASMAGADCVDPEPGLCGSGGCVFHTLPPSHDHQGGEPVAGFNTTAPGTGCINPDPFILKDLESASCKGKPIELTFNTKEAGGGGGGGSGRSTTSASLDFGPAEYQSISEYSTGDDVSNPAKAAWNFMEQTLTYMLATPVWAAPAKKKVLILSVQAIGAKDMISIEGYDSNTDTFIVQLVHDQHPNPLPVSPAGLMKAIPNLRDPIKQGRFSQILDAQFSTDDDLRVLFGFEIQNRRLALQKQKGSVGRMPASHP